MEWQKERRMRELDALMVQGKVDAEVVPILDLINAREDSFTSSSCAGRIGLLELPEIGDKVNARFLGKWHRTVEPDEVCSALRDFRSHFLYLLVQPPILHIFCRTLQEARTMFTLGRESGFKDTSFKGLVPPYLVEFLSTEHLQVPLGIHGEIFPDEPYLGFLVERANSAFLRARGKLDRLEKTLTSLEHQGMCGSPP